MCSAETDYLIASGAHLAVAAIRSCEPIVARLLTERNSRISFIGK